ncbi:MAG: hypothetical protein J6V44_05310 [Methanobrevibacter sp.]|nr:hypothetical protein [Methanobrevibacter sp.]
MASKKTKLSIPPGFYDYILYCECAPSNWPNNKRPSADNFDGSGKSVGLVNWNSTSYTAKHDAGGATKAGVTVGTWNYLISDNNTNKYPKFSEFKHMSIDSLSKEAWLEVVNNFWTTSHADDCANHACACILCQTKWGGFDMLKTLLAELKKNSDIPDYPFAGTGYKGIADATHAYTDPMKAYVIIRKIVLGYLISISDPNSSNERHRNNYNNRLGWYNRFALAFSLQGLYIDVGIGGVNRLSPAITRDTTSIDTIIGSVTKHYQNGGRGSQQVVDWGLSPEELEEKIASGEYDFIHEDSGGSGSYSSQYSGGSYSGCNSISQLGNYSNAPDANVVHQQVQSREEVLNTLMSGSYEASSVKKCDELITTDKKKRKKKEKSES